MTAVLGAVGRQWTAEEVAARLRQYYFACASEAELQAAVAEVLATEGIAFERERSLGYAGRIDFYLPDDRIGLEVKVDGSWTAVSRQLLRYARRLEIEALVLVTSRLRHGAVPESLAGTPIVLVSVTEGAL